MFRRSRSHLHWPALTWLRLCNTAYRDLTQTHLSRKECLQQDFSVLCARNLCNQPAGLGILSLVFWANRSLFAKKWAIWAIRSWSLIFGEQLDRYAHIAHFWWATWAICSQSLFWHERPERFAHSCSFVLSDLSKLLTVAHLNWAIWANSQPWEKIGYAYLRNWLLTKLNAPQR